MKEEHAKKYEELQKVFGIESTPPDDADSEWRREHVRKEMVKQFCRAMCPSCGDDSSCSSC